MRTKYITYTLHLCSPILKHKTKQEAIRTAILMTMMLEIQYTWSTLEDSAFDISLSFENLNYFMRATSLIQFRKQTYARSS